ncbi:MAG: WbqC family protein [Bacteroidales bacterium]
MDKKLLNTLVDFRKTLHKHPDVSGDEKQTAARMVDFIKQFHPDMVIENIGTYGLAFVFNGKSEGPVTMIRSELDALPIEEINTFTHKSVVDGTSHVCGHDGHMVMVAGLAAMLSEHPPEKGKVILLYQPEEETGTGALKVLKDEKFRQLKPDHIFSLHNLPGVPLGEIRCRSDIFASASVGLIVRLKGKTSHAAEPENGNSPALAMASIVQELETLTGKVSLKDFSLVTTVHVKLGERAFGTTPGYAEVMATLRAYYNEDLEKLKNAAVQKIKTIASPFGLKLEFEWVEEFSDTHNTKEAVEVIKNAAAENNLAFTGMNEPYRWSEDFGYFLQSYPGAMFGIGSGEKQPQLHNPDYDFPDSLIPKGTGMFFSIIKHYNF